MKHGVCSDGGIGSLSKSKSVSELILEGRWAMGQVTGEPIGQIQGFDWQVKGNGPVGQDGQLNVWKQRLNSIF